MTWHEAMERYGSDKPDVRFGLELVDLSEVFAATEFRAFQADVVKGIRRPGRGRRCRARQVDKLVDRAKQLGAAGLVWMRVRRRRRARVAGRSSSCPRPSSSASSTRSAPQPGDLLLVAAGTRRIVDHVLGTLRRRARPPAGARGRAALPLGRRLPAVRGPRRRRPPDPRAPPVHHAAPRRPRAPRARHAARTSSAVRSQAYDLVLNGWELGSGSVRIHRPDLQQRIFSLLGISDEDAQARFGFLLDAFRYGAPPHAGFAFGIDRLTAILAGEDNIREVIAFPKTQSGADPLTGAPSAIDPAAAPRARPRRPAQAARQGRDRGARRVRRGDRDESARERPARP